MLEGAKQFSRYHKETIALLQALGTLAAVVVSLWLARRQSRIRFVANIDVRRRFTGPGQSEECLNVQVNNLGLISATIGRLQWSVGFWPKRRYLEQAPLHIAPPGLFPRELSPGQQIDFFFPLGGSKILHNLAERFSRKTPPFLSVRLVRLRIYANNRVVTSARVSPAVRRELRDHQMLLLSLGHRDAMMANDQAR
jgi:hypothetical protein